MKKTIAVISALVLLVAAVLAFSGYKPDGYTDVYSAKNIYSGKGYIDYAEEVFLDADKYPDTAEMGLFWTRWDDSQKKIIQVPADTAEGAALADPSKPTIINIHGVLLDGYYSQERFNLNAKIADPYEFDIDADYVSMNYIWLREGWNVANFHYNRFATEMDPAFIESKIWSATGLRGMRYQHLDGTFSEYGVSDYCLAEHFAAEYIRAMRLLPDAMGDKEIRLAAHSMGGMLTTAGLFLLTELASCGQLPQKQLPTRYALLDSYFSTVLTLGATTLYTGPVDIKINWSGKNLVNNNSGDTMMACLHAIAAKGIALEYYTYPGQNFLLLGALKYAEELRTISTYAVVYPDFQGPGFTVAGDGHNGVREWYLCSILDAPLNDVTFGNTGAAAPSAALATDKLKELLNIEFGIAEGTTTVRAYDDNMMRRFKLNYELDGGKNSVSNPQKYTPFGQNIVLKNPSKRGFAFDGWYKTADFTGGRITEIDISAKKDLTLYAKWI